MHQKVGGVPKTLVDGGKDRMFYSFRQTNLSLVYFCCIDKTDRICYTLFEQRHKVVTMFEHNSL